MTEPLHLIDRGPLISITGRAIAANLPTHIPQRMADQARVLLEHAAPRIDIETSCVHAACPGAAFFLAANYQHVRAGFSSLGRRGKPAEAVAEEAANAFLFHNTSGASLDRHLADQVLVPLALAGRQSDFTCEAATSHLRTNAWVIEQFGLARVTFEQTEGKGDLVGIVPLSSPGM
jgi:RNA 3'-terminal phosphate cyclase (ATP)